MRKRRKTWKKHVKKAKFKKERNIRKEKRSKLRNSPIREKLVN